MEHRPPVTLTLTVGARADLANGRADIRRWLQQLTDATTTDDVLLACGEAIDNGLEHGAPPVTVRLGWSAEDNLLSIVVHDEGTWRISAATPPRGLGLPTMMALMDNVTVDTTNGTAIRLSCRL